MEKHNLYLRVANKMKEVSDIISYMGSKAAMDEDCDNCLKNIDSLIISSLHDLSRIGDDFTFSSAASHIIPILIELDRKDQAIELYNKVSVYFIRKELEQAYGFLC